MKRDRFLLLFLLIISGCCGVACSLLGAAPVAQSVEARQTVTKAAPVVSARNVPVMESGWVVCNCSALNIRKGPGLEYPVTGWTFAGLPADVSERAGEWAKIPDGWVKAEYLCK